MNSSLKLKPFETAAQSPADMTQYIVFKLADYRLALPSQEILKIVETPSSERGGLLKMGLVQLGKHSVQVVNLSRLFGLTESEADSGNPFLIVFKTEAQELWCIAVPEPPDLMDVPNYALKPVPSQKRLTRSLRWVSHVVTYDLSGDRYTLLILDLAVFFSRRRPTLPEGEAAASKTPPLIEPNITKIVSEGGNEPLRKSEMYA